MLGASLCRFRAGLQGSCQLAQRLEPTSNAAGCAQLTLCDAAEREVTRAMRRLHTSECATLRDRAARQNPEQIFHAALARKTRFERVAQQPDPRQRLVLVATL